MEFFGACPVHHFGPAAESNASKLARLAEQNTEYVGLI